MSGRVPRQPSDPGRPLTIRAIVVGGVLVGAVGAAAVAVLLYFYGGGTEQDQAGLDVVRTAGTLVVGTGGAVALLLAARRQRSTELTLEHQREVAQEQRITELYTRAVDQLGNDQAPVRLGGLHALERLAQNNPTQRQTIVDVICAYLRMPYTPPSDQLPTENDSPEAHLRHEQRQQELQVRLTAQHILAAHLRPASTASFWDDIDLDLSGAHLVRFDLTDCHIRNARFNWTHFTAVAWFAGAQFTGDAWFSGAKFTGMARFNDAHFDGTALFSDVRFEGVGHEGCAIFKRALFASTVNFFKAHFQSKGSFEGVKVRPNVVLVRTWPAGWRIQKSKGNGEWWGLVED